MCNTVFKHINRFTFHPFFFIYIFYLESEFSKQKVKIHFDNNYIIILYFKVECIKQRFWLSPWYLQTYLYPYNLSKCSILYLSFAQTFNTLTRMFTPLLVWVIIDYIERQNIYVLIRVYLNFIIGDIWHHHKLRVLYRNSKPLSYPDFIPDFE